MVGEQEGIPREFTIATAGAEGRGRVLGSLNMGANREPRTVTEDRIGPHGDPLAEFPYVGPPHNA
jgi:hypothetical protein